MCRIIQKSRQADDTIASQYLRSKKYVGSRDRKAISSLVFATLRIAGFTERIVAELGQRDATILKDQRGVLQVLVTVFCVPEVHEAVAPIVGGEPTEAQVYSALEGHDLQPFVHQVVQLVQQETLFEANDVLPQWLEQSIEHQLRVQLQPEDRRAYAQPAPLCLRIVQPASNREAVLSYLREHNIDYSLGSWSNDCIIVQQRVNLRETALMREGLVEVQDEASQLFALVLQPQSGERVLDVCAGAGGKTLHIADLMHREGEIVASDIDYRRLRRMIPRLRSAGVSNVLLHKFNKNVPPSEQFKGLFDAVVVDAPCSGLGTFRRSPMIKWRSSEKLVEKFHKKQLDLLHQYASMVRPGGTLLYATCSIHARENQDVVDAFLAMHDEFETHAELYPESIRELVVSSPKSHDMVRLFPHAHGTDGFFLCKFRRIRDN